MRKKYHMKHILRLKINFQMKRMIIKVRKEFHIKHILVLKTNLQIRRRVLKANYQVIRMLIKMMKM